LGGEGGYCVYEKQVPAADSLAQNILLIGLTNGVKLLRSINAGKVVTWQDVEIDPSRPAVQARREIEARFGPR